MSTPSEPIETPSGRRPVLVGLVVLAVLLLVSAGVWAAIRSGGTPRSEASGSPSSPVPTVAGPGPATDPGTPSSSTATTGPGTDEPTAPAPAGAFGPTVPIGVDTPAAVAPGVVVTVTSPQAIAGDGIGPGEIDGPSIRFAVRVRNSTSAPVSLVSAVVNAYFGTSRTPGIQLSGSGAQSLPDSVPVGAEVEGVYVFLIPADRTPTQIEVYSVPGADVLLAESATPSS